MAERTVTPIALVAGTPTADLVAGAGLSATIGSTDTFIITPVKRTDDLIIILSYAGSATPSFDAGDNPPSVLAQLGALPISVGANGEVRALFLQGGRHMQNDNTITGSGGAANFKMAAYILPRLDS